MWKTSVGSLVIGCGAGLETDRISEYHMHNLNGSFADEILLLLYYPQTIQYSSTDNFKPKPAGENWKLTLIIGINFGGIYMAVSFSRAPEGRGHRRGCSRNPQHLV